MARGRMLNSKIAEDIKFNGMSIDAQFLFMRTIPFLDRDGITLGHPALLWSKVAPLLPQYAATMGSIIDEWEQAGFVIRYQDGDTPLLFFPGFRKNQVGMRYDREPASEYAPPPGYVRGRDGLELTTSAKPIPPTSNQNGVHPPTAGSSETDGIRQPSGNPPADFRQSATRIEENRIELPCARAGDYPKNENGSGGGDFAYSQAASNKPVLSAADDYAKVAKSFEGNGFGLLTAILQDEITALLDEYPVTWILDAMRVSVSANKRSLRYVHGILRKWRADGHDPQAPGAPSTAKPPAPEPITLPPAAQRLRDMAARAANGLQPQ